MQDEIESSHQETLSNDSSLEVKPEVFIPDLPAYLQRQQDYLKDLNQSITNELIIKNPRLEMPKPPGNSMLLLMQQDLHWKSRSRALASQVQTYTDYRVFSKALKTLSASSERQCTQAVREKKKAAD